MLEENKLAAGQTICHIIGIGALGGLIAGQFAKNNYPLRIILKNQEQLRTYQQTGLTLIHRHETFHCAPEAMEMSTVTEPIQFLIVCLKAYDIMNALENLHHFLTSKSIILLVHNGLGIMEEIRQCLLNLRIISGSSTISAYCKPQFTVHCFTDGVLSLGSSIGNFSSNEVDFIRKTFQSARLPSVWEEDINPIIWNKFAFNCSLNILTALIDCSIGEVLQHPDLLYSLIRENAAILQANGVNITENELLENVVSVCKKIAKSYTSMYQDVHKQNQTEVLYLNEYMIKLAQKTGVAANVNEALIKGLYEKYPFTRPKHA